MENQNEPQARDLPGLDYEVRDEVAVVTLNRPGARNSLDMKLRRSLGQVTAMVRDDPNIRVLILTGAEGNFCAGGDLRSLSSERRTAGQTRNRFLDMQGWMRDLLNLEKPVIAAVDGAAYGGGFSLALASDFVLATDRARFCMSFAKLGMVPDLSAMYLLPRIVGLQSAKEIVFTGRSVPAHEALAMRIVHRVVTPHDLMSSAWALALRLRGASMQAIGLSKNLLNQSFELNQKTVAEMEAYAEAVCIDSEFHHRAVDAFLNKRPAPYDWDAMDRLEGEA